MHEFDHEIPEMHTIADVLDYIKSRAEALEDGQWIVVRQVFITRLAEQRYPTREELDHAAPNNPVMFSTGPDASLNTLALKESGIDKNFQVVGRGYIERDPQTGEPTGILRSCTRYVKSKSTGKKPASEDYRRRLKLLFRDYNSVGITAVADRSADSESVNRYRLLKDGGELTVRMAVSRNIDTDGKFEDIQAAIRKVAEDPLRQRGQLAADRRHQDVSRRRHAHRQRLHARAVGRERDLFDPRPCVSRRALHPQGEAVADCRDDARRGLAVHGAFRGRRRGSYACWTCTTS